MGILDNIFEPNKETGPQEGIDYYMSPEGYRIMTEYFLVKRVYCCSNGCKHCPYSPKAVKGNRTLRADVALKYQHPF